MKNYFFILKILYLFTFICFLTNVNAINTYPVNINGSTVNFSCKIIDINSLKHLKAESIKRINNKLTDFELNNSFLPIHFANNQSTDSLINNQKKISNLEYFFDADPGLGNGNQLATGITDSLDINVLIPLDSITNGFHTLYFRVKDNLNTWSLTQSIPYYKMSPNPNEGSLKNITNLEYFFDTDPGFGNGNQVTTDAVNTVDISLFIQLPSAVLNGFHTLYIRVKDNQGKWSLIQNVPFYKMSPNPNDGLNKNITYLEYFVDTDPGMGNGTSFSITNGNITSTDVIVPLQNISDGFHTIYFRVKDMQNVWSITHSIPFYKMQPDNQDGLNITSKLIEYFIDTDPGIGNGIQSNTDTTHLISKDLIVSLQDISVGFHSIYFRTKDIQNKWSLTTSIPFYKMEINTNDGANKNIVKAEYYYDNDPGFGNGIAVPITNLSNISKDFIADLSSLSNSSHKIYVRVKDDKNNWSFTYTNSFTICDPPDKPVKPDGPNQLCINSPNTSYSTYITSNTTSYRWQISPANAGTIINNNNTTTSIDWNDNYTGSVYIKVYSQNSCDTVVSDSLLVTILNPITASNQPSGSQNVYQNQSGVTYSIASIPNATSYVWTLPAGVYGYSNGSSITVNFGSSAVSGNISVNAHNACGDGPVSSLFVTVIALPDAAGAISGPNHICKGQSNILYTVPVILNADSYIWTLPQGFTGSSNTRSIYISLDNIAKSDTIRVRGHNTFGDGATSLFVITIDSLPTNAGSITGNLIVCQNQSGLTYSIPSIGNATSYSWTLPSEASGSSTLNSISVSFSTSAISGNITVYGVNSCGNGSSSHKTIEVKQMPATPTITVQNNCGNTILSSNASGSLLWNTNETTSSITVTNPATYSLTTMLNACVSLPGNAVAAPKIIPSIPTISVQNNCNYSVLSTNASGSLLWNTNDTTSSIHVNNAGDYSVISTINGCSSLPGSGTAAPIPSNPQTISISALTGTILPVGSSITFNTSFSGIVLASDIKWYINGFVHATSGYTFSYIPSNGDSVKAIIPVNGCNSGATSNTLTITIDSSMSLTSTFTAAISNAWENAANWNHGVPSAATFATIAATKLAIVNSNNYQCKNLTIAPLGKLTINAGKDLRIIDTLILQSNASGTASLIDNGTLHSATNIVERYIPHTFTDEFHMLSSPVVSQAISPVFNEPDGFFVWNEPTGNWIEYADAANFTAANGNSNFIPAKGYAVSYPTATTKSFIGNLNTGTINIPLSVTADLYSGWNFVANPYPSAINWNASSGWNRSVLENADPINHPNEKAIWVWNAQAANYGAFISNTDAATNGVSRNIALSQGFWVKAATAGTLAMNNEVREHADQAFLKSVTTDEMIRLKVTSVGNAYSDELIVSFGNISNQGGAEKMFSIEATAPSIFSSKLNKKWSISNLTSMADNATIPVGFKPGIDGNYTITAMGVQALGNVMLEDLKTDVQQNLSINNNYSFNAQTSDNENRFLLHFTSTGINEEHGKTPNIYYSNKTIHVYNPWKGKTNLYIYDITGKLIESLSINEGNGCYSYPLAKAVYVLKLENTQQHFIKKEVVY